MIPIERTHEFRGRYHVLGGALSPIDGVDPEDLRLAELYARVRGERRARGRHRDQPDDDGRGDRAAHRRRRCASGARSRGHAAGVGAARRAATSSTPTRSRSAGRSRGAARSDRCCRRAAPWAGAFLATFVVGRLFGVAGVPSSYLFGALLVGLVVALWRPGAPRGPADRLPRGAGVHRRRARRLPDSPTRSEAAADAWVAVALVSLATLGLSLLCGIALARWTSLDRPTAALGMVAGGASGIVGMAGKLRRGRPARRVHAVPAGARRRRVRRRSSWRSCSPATTPGRRTRASARSATVEGGVSVGDPRAGGPPRGGLTRLPAGSLLGPMLLAGGVGLAAATTASSCRPCCARSAFAGDRPAGRARGSRMPTVREVGRLARAGPAVHRRAHGRLLRRWRSCSTCTTCGDAPGRLPRRRRPAACYAVSRRGASARRADTTFVARGADAARARRWCCSRRSSCASWYGTRLS